MTKKDPIPRIAFLAAVLSGLMLTASFPPGRTDWLAWIALVPLLAAIHDRPSSQGFRLGFLAGFTHFLSLMYWVVVVIEAYGGLSLFLSLLVLIALCAYLALYPALFSSFFTRIHTSRAGLVLAAGLWVGLEYLRGRLLTGLPWCFLGYSQANRLALIQISDLVGVYGLSFLLASVNLVVFGALFDRRTGKSRIRKTEGGAVLLLLLMSILYGQGKIKDSNLTRPSGPALSAVIVQGNFDQSTKWLPEFQQKTMDVYTRLSLREPGGDPDLIVWPETAVPFFFQDPSPLSAGVFDIPSKTGADLLFGGPAYEEKGDTTHYFNRAYLLSPEDRSMAFYDKVHLVPFGEYVPLQQVFPFVHRLVTAAGDFSAGERVAPLTRPRYAAGVLICYEAIFPHLARRQVRKGADLLVNLTNDAWFGHTSAPYQHLCMSVFRSVETRLPMVRAANTGISAVIDPLGRVTGQTGLFEESVLVATIRPNPGEGTFYTRYGDLLPLFLLGVIFGKLIIFRRRANG